MKIKNLPTIDNGYWVAIVAASMCGANSGDLAAGPLHLGHVNGLLPMAIFFLVIIFAEKTLNWTTIAFYWLAIIVLRTMATDLADFVTKDLKISYPVFEIGLIAFMALMLFIDKARGTEASGIIGRDGVWRGLPQTDWSYWIVMLAAGTLGTAFGDWIAEKDQLNFGVYYGSLLCVPIFVGALWLATFVGKMTKPWYWVAIVACRTLGTDLGDMIVALIQTQTHSRPTSLWISTGCTAVLLAVIVAFWKHKTRDLREEMQPA